MLTEFAPAKINLYLHITGRRPDGYHDLDSLTVFAGVGDEIRLEDADRFVFALEGPQSARLEGEDPATNLTVKAAQSFAALTGHTLECIKLILVKNLPVASGIGGGSSDAAAVLRLLARHWGIPASDPRLVDAARPLGQDVPVCLKVESNYITASGTAPGPALPSCGVLLVNPNEALSTPAVYKAFREGGYGFSPFAQFSKPVVDFPMLLDLLRARKNDLYDAACTLMPGIRQIVAELQSTSGCVMSRMSGSGATCFGLYADVRSAEAAAVQLSAAHPNWWLKTSDLPYNL